MALAVPEYWPVRVRKSGPNRIALRADVVSVEAFRSSARKTDSCQKKSALYVYFPGFDTLSRQSRYALNSLPGAARMGDFMQSFPWAVGRANVPVRPHAPRIASLTDNSCSASGDTKHAN